MFELKDFQRETVEYIYSRLKETDCQRFLCADEVGLGKTIIAKGIIDKFLEARGKNLKVFYICSSQYLAKQNLEKLHPGSQQSPINRLTELILHPKLINTGNGLSILPLSPQTSVDLSSRGGKLKERVILYQLLKNSSELLRGKWESTYDRVLSLNILSWSEQKDRADLSFNEFDPAVCEKFYQALKNDQGTLGLLNQCFNGTSDNYLELIGRLRQKLATAGLESLKPDLIILDEFQRFAELLKQSESEDATDLIKALFANDKTEMLMLSATPYKMFTIRQENEAGDSHYSEFEFLTKFLMRQDYPSFIQDWKAYTDAMLSLQYQDPDKLEQIKIKVERWLYKYICRTERNIAYEESPEKSLLVSKIVPLDVGRDDIDNFMAADTIVQKIEATDETIYSPLEYCKTTPYPLSFMDNYKLKNLFNELYDEKEPEVLDAFKKADAFLPYEQLNSYSLQRFPNAKINWLIDEAVKPGSQLLWIPPALPYYKLDGPFEAVSGFSKTMIFGKYTVEPRAISTLASYAAELFTTGSQEAAVASQSSQARQYFTTELPPDEPLDAADAEEEAEVKNQTRLPRPRLYFKKDDSQMSLLCFHYPSWYLSRLVNANLNIDTNQTSSVIQDKLRTIIQSGFNDLDQYIKRPGVATDARWYLFGLLYLDNKYNPEYLKNIIDENSEYDLDSWGVNKNLDNINKYIESIVNKGPDGLAADLDLGKRPTDLEEVITLIALGGPAGIFLQSLFSNVQLAGNLPDKFTYSFLFESSVALAEAFRSFYNQPEVISIIDIYSKETNREYWISILKYNISGCLRSVMDEYIYMNIDGPAVLEYDDDEKNDGNNNENTQDNIIVKLVDLISNVLTIRTSSLNADLISNNGQKQKSGLRTHYAVAFLDQQETDETNNRKGVVQDAFNSPFRPFILATTSIGQEGLDFHKYCRELLHWSLPDNAIDLEQREGRINRYKHYALRLNLIERYRSSLTGMPISKSPWVSLFGIAENDHLLRGDKCQLIPYWHVPLVNYPLERKVPLYPFSKDGFHLQHLLRTLMVYRMSLGQPNQEDLVRYLLQNFTKDELETYKAKLIINLSPVAYAERRKDEVNLVH